MNVSWKRTFIWICVSIVMFLIPVTFVFAPFAAMTAVCHLSASVTTTISKKVKPNIPYSIAAVIQALSVTMIYSSDINSSDGNSFLAAGAFMIMIFFVPFLLIMAAVVYFSGKDKDKKEGGHNNEQQHL